MIVTNNLTIQSKNKKLLYDQAKNRYGHVSQTTYPSGFHSTNNKIKLQQNPLEQGASAQISFKGFFNPKHYQITPKLYEKTVEILETISDDQAKMLKKAVKDFAEEVKNNPNFRKRLYYDENDVKKLSEGILLSLPQKSLPHKLLTAIVEPFSKFAKKFTQSDDIRRQREILDNYTEVNGLFHSINKWENQYRRRYGVADIKDGEDFLIPANLLKGNIHRRQFEVLDPTKGQYSAKTLSVGNRVVSGIIGSTMYGIDAYNTTMRLSNNDKESNKEGKTKFIQQIIRISLAAYFTGIALGVFQNKTNRSIKNALGVSISMALLSEILGRKIVGKPILPTTKEKMEEMEKKNENSKNPFLKLEKAMKEKNKKQNSSTSSTNQQHAQIKYYSSNIPKLSFSANTSNNNQNTQNISFGKKLPKMFSSSTLKNLLDIVEEINPEQEKYFERTIKKGLTKFKEFDTQKTLRELLDAHSEIPIGEYTPMTSKARDAFLLPVKSIQNIFKSIKRKLTPDNIETNTKILKDNGLWEKYERKLARMQQSEIWQRPSSMTEAEKQNALMKEIIHLNLDASKTELSGVQNTLLWIERELLQNRKNLSQEQTDTILKEILKNKDQQEYAEQLAGIKNKLNAKSLEACARDKADYDTSLYSTANMFLGRLISTSFLVADTFNLTMLHSNNNKRKSKENGAEYAAQEISRTFFSTYLIGITNTLFKKFHNASIWGALTLTALTTSIVQFLSRYSIGKPVTPKTQEELINMENDTKRQNNPILKLIAKAFGKNTKKIDYGEKQNSNSSLINNPSLQNHIAFTNLNTYKDFLPNKYVMNKTL